MFKSRSRSRVMGLNIPFLLLILWYFASFSWINPLFECTPPGLLFNTESHQHHIMSIPSALFTDVWFLLHLLHDSFVFSFFQSTFRVSLLCRGWTCSSNFLPIFSKEKPFLLWWKEREEKMRWSKKKIKGYQLQMIGGGEEKRWKDVWADHPSCAYNGAVN